MGKHQPSSVWMLRLPEPGRSNACVRTESTTALRIEGMSRGESEWNEWGSFTLSRRDARLLAKRINQCLDATK